MNFREMMAERVLRLFLNESRLTVHTHSRAYATDVRNDIIPARERVIAENYTERKYGTPYVVYGD